MQNILQKIFTIFPALRPDTSTFLFSCIAYGNVRSSPQVLIPLLGTKYEFHVKSASVDEQDLNFLVAADLVRQPQDLLSVPACSCTRRPRPPSSANGSDPAGAQALLLLAGKQASRGRSHDPKPHSLQMSTLPSTACFTCEALCGNARKCGVAAIPAKQFPHQLLLNLACGRGMCYPIYGSSNDHIN